MANIEFHILQQAGDEARLKQACALVAQAQQQHQRVFVRVDKATMTRMDELLWTFHDQAFIPHEPLSGDAPPNAKIVAVLGLDQSLPQGFTLLVNLHDSLPPQLSEVQTIYEVIDGDPQHKQQGRERFKRYRDQGLALQTINH